MRVIKKKKKGLGDGRKNRKIKSTKFGLCEIPLLLMFLFCDKRSNCLFTRFLLTKRVLLICRNQTQITIRNIYPTIHIIITN